MSTFFKIRDKETGLYLRPKWGATGFHKHGKVYAKPGHAIAAWKNTDESSKRGIKAELVVFEVVERAVQPL